MEGIQEKASQTKGLKRRVSKWAAKKGIKGNYRRQSRWVRGYTFSCRFLVRYGGKDRSDHAQAMSSENLATSEIIFKTCRKLSTNLLTFRM